MDTLERKYVAMKQQYDVLVAANNPSTFGQIRALNVQMASVLQEMLAQVSTMRGNAAKLNVYRDQLVKKLVGVQNEHTLLQTQKDEYTAMQKLQSHEQTMFNSTFFWYGIALAIVFVIFFFVLITKGQSAPTMPTMTTSATTIPAFT